MLLGLEGLSISKVTTWGLNMLFWYLNYMAVQQKGTKTPDFAGRCMRKIIQFYAFKKLKHS